MKWLADENFRNAIIRGVLRRRPACDIIRVQDVPAISGRDDSAVLDFATTEGRIVVSHDFSTMVPAMREQLRGASRCAPIVFVPDSLPVNVAIDDILLLDACARATDWEAGVLYLPIR